MQNCHLDNRELEMCSSEVPGGVSNYAIIHQTTEAIVHQTEYKVIKSPPEHVFEKLLDQIFEN